MWLRISAAALCGWLICGAAWAQEPASAETQPAARFRLPHAPRYVGTIVEVRQGTVRLEKSDEGPKGRDEGELEEGLCLALVTKSVEEFSAENVRMLRARIVDVGEEQVVLEQSPEVAKQLSPGLFVALFALPDAAQEALADVPELATLRVDPAPRGAPESERRRLQALDHAQLIGVGLHNYADIFKCFPPAVVYGPDGTPWHSWRVLILPFMDEVDLYEKYRLDEPWNGPNNSQLLDQMPEAYGDPAHGENDGYYTHFAAVTGDGAAFSIEGARFDGNPENFDDARRNGRRLSALTDGLSNTVMVGSVEPGRKIPWMKPEDIVVGDDFPGIGVEGGFAAPHQVNGKSYGVFLFCDDTDYSVAADTDADLLRRWVAIADGELVLSSEANAALLPSRRRNRSVPFVEFLDEDGGPVAVVTLEESSSTDEPPADGDKRDAAPE